MALTEPRRWVIAYDIREPRRLARVHKFLSGVAVPLQYSVFAARGSLAEARRLASELKCLIDERVDDVRLYSIPNTPVVHTIGKPILSDAAQLLNGKSDLAVLVTGADPQYAEPSANP